MKTHFILLLKAVFFFTIIVLVVQPWQTSDGSLIYPERSLDENGKWVKNTTDKVILPKETLVEIAEGIKFT